MVIVGRHRIDVSSREKIYFPQAGLNKGDLIDYYQTVAPVMIPHTKRYGISFQRFPEGLEGEGFYTKDTPSYFPKWIKTVTIPKREGGSFVAPVLDQPAALVYLADQSAITYHLYLSRIDDLEHPDKMIYDLDPPEDTRDFSVVRNSYGATAVAPYSVRALHEAPVATPLEWEEVEAGASPRDWTIKNLPGRLEQKSDPWSGLMRHPYSLLKRWEKLNELLDQERPAREEKD